MNDVGSWIRRQCLIMAKNTHTGVDFWLQLPLVEFADWIEENNLIVREEIQARKNRSKGG